MTRRARTELTDLAKTPIAPCHVNFVTRSVEAVNDHEHRRIATATREPIAEIASKSSALSAPISACRSEAMRDLSRQVPADCGVF